MKFFRTDPRTVLSNFRASHSEQNRFFNAVQALKLLRDKVAADAIQQLKTIPIPQGIDPDNIVQLSGEVVDRVRRFHLGSELPALDSLIQLAETDDFKAFATEIEPMIAAVEAADAKAEKERLAKQRAQADLEIARVAARERALESIESDREVVAARERLERSAIPATQ